MAIILIKNNFLSTYILFLQKFLTKKNPDSFLPNLIYAMTYLIKD